MYRLILPLIALLALYSIDGATAAERVNLFQGYWYGEPLDEIRKDPRTHVVKGRFDRDLLVLESAFMGSKAKVVFQPNGEGTSLRSLVIVQDWNRDQFTHVRAGLENEYVPVWAVTGDKIFDYIVGVGSTAEESAKAARKFEHFGIQRSDLLIHFVERSAEEATGDSVNADDLETNLDRSARTVELQATDKVILLQFETAGEPDTLDIMDVEPRE
jgi:hypothetical protein